MICKCKLIFKSSLSFMVLKKILIKDLFLSIINYLIIKFKIPIIIHAIPAKNCPIPVILSKNVSYFLVLYIPHNTKSTPKSINDSFKIIL